MWQLTGEQDQAMLVKGILHSCKMSELQPSLTAQRTATRKPFLYLSILTDPLPKEDYEIRLKAMPREQCSLTSTESS